MACLTAEGEANRGQCFIEPTGLPCVSPDDLRQRLTEDPLLTAGIPAKEIPAVC